LTCYNKKDIGDPDKIPVLCKRVVTVYVIMNNSGDILCKPGTDEAYTFENQEAAVKFVSNTGIKGDVVDLSATTVNTEERYGGQNDLW